MEHYFQKLHRAFQGNPYQDRFIKELQGHADDLAEDQKLNKHSLNFDFMKKHFGEPKEVKKDFINITRPWQRWLEVGEMLGYGILIIMWLSLAPIIGLLQGPYYNLTYLAAFLLVILPYLFVWQKLLSAKDKLLGKKMIVSLVILPSLASSISSLFKVLSDVYHPVHGMEIDVYAAVAIGSVVIGLITSLFFPIKRALPFNQKYLKFIAKIFGFLFFLYIMAYAILMMLGHPFDFHFSFGVENATEFVDYFFAVAHYIESGLLIFLPTALFSSIHSIHFFQILIILTLFLGPIAYFATKKRFSWLAITGLVYALFFIVVPHTNLLKQQARYFDPINIHVPYVKVSQMIEQRQYSLFYDIVHYLRARYGEGFGYQIALYENQFAISQSSTYYSFYDHINVYMNSLAKNDRVQGFILNENEGDYSIQKKDADISFDQFPEKYLPGSLTCKGGSYGSDGKTRDESHLIFCKNLFFKNQEIVSKNEEFIISDFVLSKNETRLLIATDKGVYLLDLSSINPPSE